MAILRHQRDELRSRQDRAYRVLRGSSGWAKIRTKDGKPLAYGIPSEHKPGLLHMTSEARCTCVDHSRGYVCKHILAVRMHVARVRGEREMAAIRAAAQIVRNQPVSDPGTDVA